MIACHCGDPATAEADLKPLRQFGPPAADLIQSMPYPVINTLSDAGYRQHFQAQPQHRPIGLGGERGAGAALAA